MKTIEIAGVRPQVIPGFVPKYSQKKKMFEF
jgi:hypothetical protein